VENNQRSVNLKKAERNIKIPPDLKNEIVGKYKNIII